MSGQELSQEAQDAIRKVEKLLKLAAKNPSEEEASSAAAKAQEMLAKYNLDMAMVERASGESAKREQAMFDGGLYQYQRDMWQAVASLNFCMYWHEIGYDWNRKTFRRTTTYKHRVVGRTVNVRSTVAMSEYLLQAVERLTRERVGDPSQYFTKWAHSYREGMVARVEGKIYARRKELLSEAKQKEMEAAMKAAKAGMSTGSDSTALTLSTYSDQETDANIDFVYGEGTSARWAANRAERAAEERAKEEDYTKWAAENPEKARAEEESKRKERRATGGKVSKKVDWGAYNAGYKAGDKVSLDQQTGTTKPVARIGGR